MNNYKITVIMAIFLSEIICIRGKWNIVKAWRIKAADVEHFMEQTHALQMKAK